MLFLIKLRLLRLFPAYPANSLMTVVQLNLTTYTTLIETGTYIQCEHG